MYQAAYGRLREKERGRRRMTVSINESHCCHHH
jgi:hypothetical protein